MHHCFFWFLYLFFLMKYYGSIVIFPTFSVYFVSLVLSASPFSSKLVYTADRQLPIDMDPINQILYTSLIKGLSSGQA